MASKRFSAVVEGTGAVSKPRQHRIRSLEIIFVHFVAKYILMVFGFHTPSIAR